MEIKAKEIIVDGNTSYKYYKPKFCCKALEENPRIIISNEYPEKEICSKDNFSSEIVLPNQLGKQYLEFTLERIEKYINWNFLLHKRRSPRLGRYMA